MDSPHNRVYATKHAQVQDDSTQASYSPQDEAIQAPTRSVDPGARGNYPRMGSIQDDTVGGGRFSSHLFPKENKPPRHKLSLSPQIDGTERRKSFIERIEAAGRNVYERSTSNTNNLIDRLADTLNTLSSGVDDHEQPTLEENKNRWSWPMSLIFQQKDNDQQASVNAWTHHSKPQEADTSAFEATHPNEDYNTAWPRQDAVEAFPSDKTYDMVQGTVPVESDTLQDNGSVQQERQQQQRDGNDSESQSTLFNTNPESGRVPVPPLSVPVKPSPEASPADNVTSSTPHPKRKNRGKKKNQHVDMRVASTRKTKRLAELKDPMIYEKQAQFDSDFENWNHKPALQHKKHTPKTKRN